MGERVNDELILGGLLTQFTVKGAADWAGCSVRTVYERLQEPGFRARYERERARIIERVATDLVMAGELAVQELVGVLTDPEASRTERVSAANSILRHMTALNRRGSNKE